jgi:hypothetical protein
MCFALDKGNQIVDCAIETHQIHQFLTQLESPRNWVKSLHYPFFLIFQFHYLFQHPVLILLRFVLRKLQIILFTFDYPLFLFLIQSSQQLDHQIQSRVFFDFVYFEVFNLEVVIKNVVRKEILQFPESQKAFQVAHYVVRFRMRVQNLQKQCVPTRFHNWVFEHRFYQTYQN